MDTLLDILGREPRYPRQLNPRVPRGLELICLKCLAKSPADRYRSAAALADDLERFARHEPLAVQPPNVFERVVQWTRRQPALASRLGALGVFYLVEIGNYHYGGVDWPFHFEDHAPGRRLGRDRDRLPVVRRPPAAGVAGPFRLGHARFAHALDRAACSWPTARPAPWWSAIRC